MERKTIAAGMLTVLAVSMFAIWDPFNLIQPEEVTGVCGHQRGFPKDGFYSINVFNVDAQDVLAEYADVTPTTANAKLANGKIIAANSMAAGIAVFKAQICEGQTILVELDEATDHYPTQATFTIGDITVGDDNKANGKCIGTVPMRGMDASSDAGIVTVYTGQYTLWNGTHQEDQLNAAAASTHTYRIHYDWAVADEEYFGIVHQTSLVGENYEYSCYVRFNVTLDSLLSEVKQGGVALADVKIKETTSFIYYTYELIPFVEDEDVTADEQIEFTFKVVWPNASGDTLEIEFFDEIRSDFAERGIMETAADEAVGPMTTT